MDSSTDRHSWTCALLLTLICTLASLLGTNPYQFGVGDNSITLPIVHAYADPRLYPGDYLIAQRFFYYTYLWSAIAWVQAHWDVELHTVFLGVYAVALFATFLAVYLLAIRLFRSTRVAALALVFLLFRHPTLAGIDTVEAVLNTREVALPFVLFALWAWLNRRTVLSFVLLGLGYLVHPLTIHPALAMLAAAAVVDREPGRRRSTLVGLATFGALASPILAWRWRHAPPSFHLGNADPGWVAALHLRSPHHMFPSTWGSDALLHVALTLLLAGVAWRSWRSQEPRDRRVVAAWGITVLVLCAAGVVFAEVLPMGADFLFQPLRAFQFMDLLAVLGVANLVVRSIERSETALDLVPPLVAGLALFYGVPHEQRPMGLFIAMAAVLAALRFGGVRAAARAFSLVACVVVAAAGAGLDARAERRSDPEAFSAENAQDDEWLDVQQWARDHTDMRDAFIVPPNTGDEFRVRSRRTVYADWEDGGLMNANPAFGLEWMRRMQRLGFRGLENAAPVFRPLRLEDVRGIADELRPAARTVYLVEKQGKDGFGLPVRYRNRDFFVAEVTNPAAAGIASR